MKLDGELAMKIISEVKPLIQENIIIVNADSIIIASTDNSRINDYHEGAQVVMRSKEKLYINEAASSRLKGVKPGINLPIIFNKEIIGVIGITGLPEEIEPFAELFRRMTELIVREAYIIEKKEWETRGLESFIYDWIYSSELNDSLLSKGEIHGISFTTPYLCVIFEVHRENKYDDVLGIQKFMENWFRQIFSKDDKDHFIPWGYGRFLMIRKQEDHSFHKNLLQELTTWQEELQARFGIQMAVGIGKTIQKKSLTMSYKESLKALKVAKRKHRIIFYEDLLLDILVGEIEEQTKEEYIQKILSPIMENQELYETLVTYFKNNQSLKNTAKSLHIHLNTLNYRLKKIEEMTAINPKEIEGISTLYLALFINDSFN